jgi:hypothetical protein
MVMAGRVPAILGENEVDDGVQLLLSVTYVSSATSFSSAYDCKARLTVRNSGEAPATTYGVPRDLFGR